MLPVVCALVCLASITVGILGGVTGFLYLALLAIVAIPGVPLGLALFGRNHAAGWIAGAAFGYAMTTFAWWAAIFSGHASPGWLAGAWAAAVLISATAALQIRSPAVVLPPWTKRDTTALCLVLLMVPAIVTRPFDRIGSVDDQGNRRYRAYFMADFVWHTALTAELAKSDPRPRNPFMAAEPVHYYWTYFRVPASIASQTGIRVETALKLNAAATAFLFVAAIYLAAWAALPAWPLAAAAGVALTVLGPSAEGLAATVDLLRRGHPLSELRDLNIDAVASWAFKGLRIDNLPRAMWYTPQHSLSCALGLLSVPIAIWGGIRAPWPAILGAGCALGAALAVNPLLGAAFAAVYGLTVLTDGLRTAAPLKDWTRNLLIGIPLAAALAWCTVNQVGDGASDVLRIGFFEPARNATLLNIALQLGPILIPIAVGLWPGSGRPFRTMWPAIAGLLVGVLLMHFVVLTVNPAWVGFRGGQLFLVLAPAVVASALVRLWTAERRLAAGLVALVLISGTPTTIVDAYNAQDVTNRGLSPGAEFHWTVVVSRLEAEALDWIRRRTPPRAIVQAEPVVRGRETWTLIPTFAERRMATGNALPLLNVPTYAVNNERVRAIFADTDAVRAWQTARDLNIDYLYVGRAERAAYPAVSKFDAHADLFTPVFRNAEAGVYLVERLHAEDGAGPDASVDR